MTLCKAIATGLGAVDFDVLWDANLPTGESWRGAIDEWIWNCDAAVLVLSKDAVDSPYVTYEATHLRQRWLHMKPRFALIPVWCSGVDEQVLVKRMGTLQIAEIHTNVKLAAWPVQGAEAAFDSQVQEIIQALEGVRQQAQPRHEIEDLLILDLDLGTANDNALAAIANAYQLPPLPPGAKKDRAILLARMLIDSKEALGYARFQRLKSGIPAMMAALESSKDRAPRIVKLVAPFCWVSPDCVARLPKLLSQPAGGIRAIGWVRRWQFSERMYLYRTFCTRSKLRIASPSELSGGSSQAAFDHILACLGEKVCHDATAKVNGVTKRIKKLADSGEPVFLILPADSIHDELLTLICSTWPDLCVFLYTEKMDEQQLVSKFPTVQVVQPPLVEDDEEDARIGWGDCMVAAGWTAQQLQNIEEFDS